jgi:hypothetical protein
MASLTTTSSTLNNSNLETFSLVWVDTSINNSQENLDTQYQLRTIINHLRTFEDTYDCENYIRSVSNHDRIIIIVSGLSGRQLVPRIHELQQVCSIYVYCMDRKTNEEWTQNYTKVNNKCCCEIGSKIPYEIKLFHVLIPSLLTLCAESLEISKRRIRVSFPTLCVHDYR